MSDIVRILAVDDEAIIGESIAYNLEAPHRKISVAMNGKEALNMAFDQKFDLIITDLSMPEAGGLEMVRELRQRNYEGKIIVLSGNLSPDDNSIYEELKIDEVVDKPCIMQELREIVDDLEKSFVPSPTE
jgi:DNA-binding response OmpR family regulator